MRRECRFCDLASCTAFMWRWVYELGLGDDGHFSVNRFQQVHIACVPVVIRLSIVTCMQL